MIHQVAPISRRLSLPFEASNVLSIIGERIPRIVSLISPSFACLRCQVRQLSDESLIAIIAHSHDDECIAASAAELSRRLSVPWTATSVELVASPVELPIA